jgi:hypothetical protein
MNKALEPYQRAAFADEGIDMADSTEVLTPVEKSAENEKAENSVSERRVSA